MALTPQEIATGVLNSDRTVADVQSIRTANLPFGVYESLLQQARRNEERSANNVTSSQIEAGYGQQSRPDVTGLANREAPSYAAPKRQNVRPQRTGVVGGGRIRTSSKGSAGVPNEPVRTMTTPDGKGIITDGNLNEEMAKTDRQSVGYNIPDYVMKGENVPELAPENAPNKPDADKNSSELVPALVGLAAATAAGGLGAAVNAYNGLNPKASEEIKATEKHYKQAQKEAGFMSNKDYKADTANKATAIRNEMVESLKSNNTLMREYIFSRAASELAGETPETWEEFLERKQAIPTEKEISRMGGSRTNPKFNKTAPFDVLAGAEKPTTVDAWKQSPYKPVTNPMGDLGEASAAGKLLKLLGPVGALAVAGKSVYDDTTDGEYHSEPDKLKNAGDKVLDFMGLNSILPAEYQDPIRTLSYAVEDIFGIPHSAELERFIKNKYDNMYNERKLINDITRNKSLFDADKQPDPDVGILDEDDRAIRRITQ